MMDNNKPYNHWKASYCLEIKPSRNYNGSTWGVGQVRLDMHSRQEIIKADGEEYRSAGNKGRGASLDRLVTVTGLNRDYMATVLGRYVLRRAAPGRDGRSGLPGSAAGNRTGTPRTAGFRVPSRIPGQGCLSR
jgi:hypothetical protein